MQTFSVYEDLTHAKVSRMSTLNHAQVLGMSTLKTFLSLAVKLKLKTHQEDPSTAFLNAILDEKHYVKAAPGYYDLIPEGNYKSLTKT